MNLKDIKIEALKLMFANDDNLSTNNFEDLTNNPNYADYLAKMNGSISRAMQRVQVMDKVPCKLSGVINAVEDHGEWIIDLNENVNDCYHVNSVNRYGKHIERFVSFDEIVDNVIKVENKGEYRVSYYPILPIYNDNTPNETEVPLPNYIAVLIPFYVKSELLEEEEPSMAAQARNLFEASLEEINKKTQTVQTHIKRVL